MNCRHRTLQDLQHKMQLPKLILFKVLFYISSLSKGKSLICDSPQYLELGKPGIISCVMEENFFGIYWYNSTDSANNNPMLFSEGSTVGGYIYPSEEYRLLDNGSLSILHVTLQHEHTYRVLLVIDKENGLIERRDIKMIVLVTPLQRYPLISQCGMERGCLANTRMTDVLKCTVSRARPAVMLKWVLRTSFEDVDIPSNTSVTPENNTLSTATVIPVPFTSTVLLVCKSLGPHPLLQHEESYILLEGDSTTSHVRETISLSTELGTQMILQCPSYRATFLKWERHLKSEIRQTIAFAVFGPSSFSRVLIRNYEVGQNGSLIFNKCTPDDEGIFVCLRSDGTIYESNSFSVSVFAYPKPNFPVVKGCNGTGHCNLTAKGKQMLKCSLFGVRPLVHLEWHVLDAKLDENKIFSSQRHDITKNEEGTYDVHVTTDFIYTSHSGTKVNVACKTKTFNYSTSVEIVLIDDYFVTRTSSPAQIDELKKLHLLWLLLPCIVLLLITIGYKYHKAAASMKNDAPVQNQEVSPMFKNEAEEIKYALGDVATRTDDSFHKQESMPFLSNEEGRIKDGQEEASCTKSAENRTGCMSATEKSRKMNTQDIFIQQLRNKYQMQCETIRPIPFIRDNIYGVNNIFVEGIIEAFPSGIKVHENKKPNKLENYHDLLKCQSPHGIRKIVQGEPGYGKSTLALKMAHDWCTKNVNSSLRNTEILILLRLRQLYKVASIYKAIKLFLLPHDTLVTEEDIESILQNCSSSVVVLDGYDEYPGEEGETLTDINRIIKGDMFQRFLVILFTRPSSMPLQVTPRTQIARLTGFDKRAQKDYILKVVTKNTAAAERVHSKLQENPILGDLCEIPLFFVMFAHLSHETKEFQQVNSVTGFFRHVTKCFHSHFQNKLSDDNVRQYHTFENEHQTLDEVSFEALKSSKRYVWEKKELHSRVGNELFEYYRLLGILHEENVFDFELMENRTDVTFHHKLFCEWYAAHHLSRLAQKSELFRLKRILRKLDLFELHFLFRFACGLSNDAAKKIIKYVNSIKEGEKFAILCTFEQSDNFNEIEEIVSELCSKDILLHNDDNRVLQRSIIQLMVIASRNEIPILSLWLRNSLKSVDLVRGTVHLKGEIDLPTLHSLVKLHIYSEGLELTVEETLDCIKYALMCNNMEHLWFNLCLLPWKLESECVLSDVHERNLKVSWAPSGYKTFTLNRHGQWMKKDGTILDDLEYQKEVIRFQPS